jgi:hypothetical protein
MSWQIILAAGIGVVVSYLFRYRVEMALNFIEYVVYEWRALLKGIVGAGAAVLLWPYVGTAMGWVGVSVEWPALSWELAAVVGFAGRKLFEMAPQAFKYVLDILGKKFQA